MAMQDYCRDMKPVNVVAPQQSHQHPTPKLMNGEEDCSLNELRLCEKMAEKQLLQLREKRAEMEKIVEEKRQRAIEEEELRRNMEAHKAKLREIAIAKLAKEKAELAKRREEMEKEFRQREAEAAEKMEQLQNKAESLKVAEWSVVSVDEKGLDDVGKIPEQNVQGAGFGWMGSWLTAPKKWIGNWMTPEKREEPEEKFQDRAPVPSTHQSCEEVKEQKEQLGQPETASLSLQQELQQRFTNRAERANIHERIEVQKNDATGMSLRMNDHDKDDDLPPPPAHLLSAISPTTVVTTPHVVSPTLSTINSPSARIAKAACPTSNDARSSLFSEIRSGKFNLKTTAAVAPVQSAKPLATPLPQIQPMHKPVQHTRPRPPVPPKPIKLRSPMTSPVIPQVSESNDARNTPLPNIHAGGHTQADTGNRTEKGNVSLKDALEELRQRMHGSDQESEEEEDTGDWQ